MSVDKRVERNIKSVLALRDWLREIASKPATYGDNTIVRQGLNSQGRLAKLADESRGIVASSLNTLKRISEEAVEGGFQALDALRIAALTAIIESTSRPARPRRSEKGEMQLRLRALEVEASGLRQDLLMLTKVLETSLRQARKYAEESGQGFIVAKCKREQRELRDKLSLLRQTTNSSGDAARNEHS